MSFESLFQTVWALLPRDSAQVQAILADQRVLLLCFMLTLLKISASLVHQARLKSGIFTIAGAVVLAYTFVALQQSEFDLNRDRVFIGGDLRGHGSSGSASLQSCESECLANARCVAFSFDQVLQRCALKAEIARMNTLPGVVSGIRRGGLGVRGAAGQPSR